MIIVIFDESFWISGHFSPPKMNFIFAVLIFLSKLVAEVT